MSLRFWSALLVGGLVLVADLAQADDKPWYAGELRGATGFDFRTGDFGRDGGDTDIWSVPFSLEYRLPRVGWGPRDRVRVKLSIPYLRIAGPDRGEANEVGASGLDDGMGDLSLRSSYLLRARHEYAPHLELSGRVKFPTASEEDNLGTGEFDFTLEGRASKTFRAGRVRLTPFAAFGHKWVGTPPGRKRRDTFRSSAGLALRMNRRLSFGARYAWRESSVAGRGDRHELLPFLGVRITKTLRVSPYALVGLSKRAADVGAGLQIRVSRDLF